MSLLKFLNSLLIISSLIGQSTSQISNSNKEIRAGQEVKNEDFYEYVYENEPDFYLKPLKLSEIKSNNYNYNHYPVALRKEDYESTTGKSDEATSTKVTEASTEATNTTEAPPARFGIDDIKVPANFLRIEYMIDYVLMGMMYGLGFLVMYQTIIVPFAKGLVFLLYIWAVWNGVVEPVTLQQALEALPPI